MLGGAAGIFSQVASSAADKLSPTPPETEGPFYPVTQQKDKDFDLTRVQGRDAIAAGKVVTIIGRVLGTDGNPIEDAMVELWQANAAGRYAHPRDTSKAPLDPNFQGWAIVPSGKVDDKNQGGSFKLKTIVPGAYAAADGWTRPPHIHFKISKFGYQPLTTQMYFPGEKLNDTDLLLKRKSKDEQAMMIAKPLADKPDHLQYDIILAKVDEAKAPQQE